MQIKINFMPRSQNLFIVGGTVRDLLLNRPPRDYDIVTTGDPADAAARIAEHSGGRVVKLGKPGMVLYRVISSRIECDVTAAREGSIRSDLMARDFTVNAMALSTVGGDLIDPANGQRDLEQKIIRMISAENLRSDPVRYLRAWRLAAELSFSISPETLAAIAADGERIIRSAGERIRDELIKFFSAPVSADYVGGLAGTRMASAIFPGIENLKGCTQNAYHDFDVFDHTLKTYAFMERILKGPASAGLSETRAMDHFSDSGNPPLLKCAALLHDIGKPAARTTDENGRIHFYGHEQIGADMAGGICRNLRFSNSHARYLDIIIRNHLRPLMLFTAYQRARLSPRAVNRFFLKAGRHSIDMLLLAVADALGKAAKSDADGFIAFADTLIATYIDRFSPDIATPNPINGHDVMSAFDLPPSPLIGEILAFINEQRLLQTISSRDEALDRAKKFLMRRTRS
jgi:putative nucleotidyltransferase with HDIG domain